MAAVHLQDSGGCFVDTAENEVKRSWEFVANPLEKNLSAKLN